MKKILYFTGFFASILTFSAYSLKPLVTKSVHAQYSGLGGRRYHIPRDSAPVLITHEPRYLDSAAVLANDYDTAELIAHERNRALRDDQLARTSRRTYGSYGIHSSSLIEPHK